MAARAAARSPGAIARADAHALPLRDASADALLLTFPAQYALSPAFWSEAARVVKPGGRLRILLHAGAAYASAGSSRLTAPGGAWRARRATIRAGDATLTVLLARRL